MLPGVVFGDSFPIDINKSGAVIGTATLIDGVTTHAFRKLSTVSAMEDIQPTDPNYGVTLEAIGDSGVIVGTLFNETTLIERACRYRGNGYEDLGTLGGLRSYAYDVNADGNVVGQADKSDNTSHAAAWKSDGVIIDLDAWLDQVNPAAGANWTLQTATRITNNGLIIGRGRYQGTSMEYILDAGGFLPEPTLCPFLGVILFLSRRCKSRQTLSA
jgi:probable HAF family extracellular repeat protein